jgi:hypothetical protein
MLAKVAEGQVMIYHNRYVIILYCFCKISFLAKVFVRQFGTQTAEQYKIK